MSITNPFTKQVVENAFCATGKGGGIDPTCGARDYKSLNREAAKKEGLRMLAGHASSLWD